MRVYDGVPALFHLLPKLLQLLAQLRRGMPRLRPQRISHTSPHTAALLVVTASTESV